MSSSRRLPLIAVALACFAPLAAQAQVTASLVSADSSIQPGHPTRVAVRLDHAPGWHTYWLNPGTGTPTKLEFAMPTGWKASEIDWPVPRIIRGKGGGITGHGYHGVAYLPVTLTPPVDAKPGESVALEVHAKWLMCTYETCIPGNQRAQITLPVSTDAPKPNAEVAAVLARLPMPHSAKGWQVSANRESRQITLKVAGAALRSPHFFGEEEEYIEFDQPQVPREESGGYTFVLPVMEDAPTNPDRLKGVLAYTDTAGVYRGLRVDVPFGKAGANTSADTQASPPTNSNSTTGGPQSPPTPTDNLQPNASMPDQAASTASMTDVAAPSSLSSSVEVPAAFLVTLLLGLVGGLMLNLMPCVFPVLGIKVLGFVNQAGTDRARITRHGLVFTLGVLISFWALAGILAALRGGGAGLGWGFQLQSPAFVFTLTLIMLIFGLNLSGVFELGLKATAIGGNAQMQSGYAGSFLSGVLATVVATPCSAPFLAPALGAALAVPIVESFAIFTAIAIGFASPYLFLSVFPRLIARLPRPGRWMETCKQAMAFPLYATAAYLIWVLAGQTEEDIFLGSLIGLTLVAMGVWLYGRYNKPERTIRRATFATARLASVLLLVLGSYWGWPQAQAASEVTWEHWSPERVGELRAEGRPIYVDFTARWCATCQANKKVVFGSDKVLRAFAQQDVATLKADWTNQDPRITAELARWKRSAVPFNLIYRPGKSEPVVLPSILTPDIVLNALSP